MRTQGFSVRRGRHGLDGENEEPSTSKAENAMRLLDMLMSVYCG
eukprot:CAMPEP_0194314488 /NCGR_PEP_ID=MMETSP0171-20130528/11337_1 /TAXON_ID=218684 /ORGANISM="Corethron pennatum, Strain L29A3" /LENGTH=43 /DNA_ID= /DNA_START= /DNA_END= /DNA_ORIENTATION=